jgi:hypothetical protein
MLPGPSSEWVATRLTGVPPRSIPIKLDKAHIKRPAAVLFFGGVPLLG